MLLLSFPFTILSYRPPFLLYKWRVYSYFRSLLDKSADPYSKRKNNPTFAHSKLPPLNTHVFKLEQTRIETSHGINNQFQPRSISQRSLTAPGISA